MFCLTDSFDPCGLRKNDRVGSHISGNFEHVCHMKHHEISGKNLPHPESSRMIPTTLSICLACFRLITLKALWHIRSPKACQIANTAPAALHSRQCSGPFLNPAPAEADITLQGSPWGVYHLKLINISSFSQPTTNRSPDEQTPGRCQHFGQPVIGRPQGHQLPVISSRLLHNVTSTSKFHRCLAFVSHRESKTQRFK